MKKITINGEDYIKVSALCREIKKLKQTVDIRYGGFSKYQNNSVKVGYGDILRAVFKEELDEALANATTQEEIRAAHEMVHDIPGKYIVYRRTKHKKIFDYFMEWDGGRPIIGTAEEAMIFKYEGMAKSVAEKLGEEWLVTDISAEAVEESKKLLDAIFKEPKVTKEDADSLKELLAEFLTSEEADKFTEEEKDDFFEGICKRLDNITE